jgi:hypothetical protein
MMIVKEIQIQIVLNKINVGNDFLIDAQINAEEVANVKKCIYHNSMPNIRPGIMITAFAIQADNSMIL